MFPPELQNSAFPADYPFTPLDGFIYQAVPGFEDHLEKELNPSVSAQYGPFLYHAKPQAPVFWHQNAWLAPFRLEFSSISQAAGALRSIQRNWAPCLFTQFRRGFLIAEKLPPLNLKKKPFPWLIPDVPMGAWTLLDEHTMIASALCTSPFPGGKIEFEEDRLGPPSRAYLKLWEALTLARTWPAEGERCLDAGASPGGWTWALARLGAELSAVDRSPLNERISVLPAVRFIKHDAFTLKPEDMGPMDWLFCDAACYPARLFNWIEKWLASGLCKNYVCTIKMQGTLVSKGTRETGQKPDFDTVRRFAELPDSMVIHLYHNKHELCWMKLADKDNSTKMPVYVTLN